MAVTLKLSRSSLQTNKYTYTWKRTDGDGAYIGPLDRDRVSKVEGYWSLSSSSCPSMA